MPENTAPIHVALISTNGKARERFDTLYAQQASEKIAYRSFNIHDPVKTILSEEGVGVSEARDYLLGAERPVAVFAQLSCLTGSDGSKVTVTHTPKFYWMGSDAWALRQSDERLAELPVVAMVFNAELGGYGNVVYKMDGKSPKATRSVDGCVAVYDYAQPPSLDQLAAHAYDPAPRIEPRGIVRNLIDLMRGK